MLVVFELGIIFEDPFSGPPATQNKTLSEIVYLKGGVRCAIHVNIDVRLRRVIILHYDAPPCLLSYNDQAKAEVDEAVDFENKGIE